MPTKTKDDYLAKYVEAIEQRTPSNIINEGGYDFTIGSVLRSMGEGLSFVVAVSDQTNETEIKKQARDTLFILAGVTTTPASRASGDLVITSTQSITIPEGQSVFSTDLGTKVGEVVEDVSFVNAETLNVTMIADTAGADVIFEQNTLYIIADFQTGTNPTVISNGTDEESDYQRSQRVRSALLAKTSGTVQSLTNTAENVKLFDEGTGEVTESVVNVLISFPWKTEDPNTIEPERLGEIVISIQSSLGVPTQDLLDEIELQLVGTNDLDPQGRQGAGQNVLVQPVGTEDISFYVEYVPTQTLNGTEEDEIEDEIQSKITSYVKSLTQGESIIATDWQAAISGDNKPEKVSYYNEQTLSPSTNQSLDVNKIWNITDITVINLGLQ